ncbi:hypothetical protein, partial [Serratia fonticola]
MTVILQRRMVDIYFIKISEMTSFLGKKQSAKICLLLHYLSEYEQFSLFFTRLSYCQSLAHYP